MELSGPASIGKRAWHIVRVVCYMLRKGISKQKLMMELRLLLKRGKIAGKVLANLMSFHHHHHHDGSAVTTSRRHHSSFSCLSLSIDPNVSYYNPHEVEFSCSNTPSYSSFHTALKRKNRHNYDAKTIAKALEILNSEISDADSVVASSPVWGFGKSPMVVRPQRITDSPFPVTEEKGEADGHIDKEAEEFIRRFYEQLRRQQHFATATPTPTPTPGHGYYR